MLYYFACHSHFIRIPMDIGRKLNLHKTFRRLPGRLLKVFCTFNLRPVSTGMPFVCIVCPLYITRMYLSVIRISLVWTRMSLVCTRMSPVCHSCVLLFIRMSFVCTRMSSVCHSSVVLLWTVISFIYTEMISSSKMIKHSFLFFWTSI